MCNLLDVWSGAIVTESETFLRDTILLTLLTLISWDKLEAFEKEEEARERAGLWVIIWPVHWPDQEATPGQRDRSVGRLKKEFEELCDTDLQVENIEIQFQQSQECQQDKSC